MTSKRQQRAEDRAIADRALALDSMHAIVEHAVRTGQPIDVAAIGHWQAVAMNAAVILGLATHAAIN